MRRLYVESNFVLELVFAQDHRDQCEDLLTAAEQGVIELVIPAYCLGEPFETLGRRHRGRLRLQDELQSEIKQLRRVVEYDELLGEADATVGLFARSAREDVERLDRYYQRICAVAVLAPLSTDAIVRSLALRVEFDLSMQDAIVLASVEIDLDERPAEAAFVTRNSKDFDDPGVRSDLEARNTRLLINFGAAVGFALHNA